MVGVAGRLLAKIAAGTDPTNGLVIFGRDAPTSEMVLSYFAPFGGNSRAPEVGAGRLRRENAMATENASLLSKQLRP